MNRIDHFRTAPATYEIRLAAGLHTRWEEWFEGFSLDQSEAGETVLRGLVRDQAELHGVLDKIRDLNLTLLYLRRIDTSELNSSAAG
jgi:hypothetical protein